MKKIALIISSLILLSGCVSTKTVKVNKEELKLLKPSSMALTSREKPDFSALTADKAMFALVGAVASISAGNKIIFQNNIEDPANYIQAELAKEISTSYNLKINTEEVKKIDTSKVSKIAENFPESDLVLDIETTNWSFVYFPTDWDNYRVLYNAKLRLIDTKSSSIIAEGFCSQVPKQTDSSPSYDELLANKAERLKQELKVAANKCISEFKTNVLGITS